MGRGGSGDGRGGDGWAWQRDWAWVCMCVCDGGRGSGRVQHWESWSYQPPISVRNARHKHPRAVSKFCWRIKVIKTERGCVDRGAGGRGGGPRCLPPSPPLQHHHLHLCCALAHTPALSPSEIMVFAFICQRSIFQTSDKRGNWTGNRLKCCKSTKHNYQKALKLPNRIHILKMLKWMSPSHNERPSRSPIPASAFWSRHHALLNVADALWLPAIWTSGGCPRCALTCRH